MTGRTKQDTRDRLLVGRSPAFAAWLLVLFTLFLSISCGPLEQPESKVFYSETIPPRAQEFRWSNGKMPTSLDPAKASAPPDTDIVRAIFDGLTEIDPKTLEASPAIATKWEASEKGRVWVFELRKDARWTNGEPVRADDFVRSWKRLARLGGSAAHNDLIGNIVGMADDGSPSSANEAGNAPDPQARKAKDGSTPKGGNKPAEEPAAKVPAKISAGSNTIVSDAVSDGEKEEFGVEAVEEFKLRVTLKEPDAQFPRLAAHPVLRPVYGDGEIFGKDELPPNLVTNGAFVISGIDENSVTLERSEGYYGKGGVSLERVRIFAAEGADAALAAYRAGEVDAVTNTQFEPLALKLLTPFVDFRRTTHSALNYYEFNRKRQPFNDRRVREAMAIAIDRKRITEGLMEGATQPAYGFLPFGDNSEKSLIVEDLARAKALMQKAGFERGDGFPVVRLVINRNKLQQRIAETVASMWKEGLGIETEIVSREIEEIEGIRESGEYDLIRRGAVLPTSDETANMLALFRPADEKAEATEQNGKRTEGAGDNSKTPSADKSPLRIPEMPPPLPEPTLGLSEFDGLPPGIRDELTVEIGGAERVILTEAEAIIEVPAIPLYFPTSYSLVKPYVYGFDINTLDAPLLKSVRIDSGWRPGRARSQS